MAMTIVWKSDIVTALLWNTLWIEYILGYETNSKCHSFYENVTEINPVKTGPSVLY